MAEARRLWERERSREHITSVQAAAIIGYVLNCDGVDKVGFHYLRASIDMARQMGLFSRDTAIMDVKKRAVFTTTAWGLFCLDG
jgi:hypothetical protein